MKQRYFFFLMALIMPVLALAQSTPAAPMNLPKDAPVNVSIADAKTGNLLSNEIVIFKSRANGTEFQGLSDSTGKFSLRLPNGTKYDIYILGFHDSTSYNVLDIPALKDNQYYKLRNYSVPKVAIRCNAFKTLFPFLIVVSITDLRMANTFAL